MFFSFESTSPKDMISKLACDTASSITFTVCSAVALSKSVAAANFSWDAVPGATAYDLLRGRVADWPVGSNPATETCLSGDVSGTTGSDASIPAEGGGYWYLVRAANACGAGSYGSQASHGAPTAPRTSATCP